MSVQEFELGDRVKFSRNLVRKGEREFNGANPAARSRYMKRWVPDSRIIERDGVIVGKRTIYDGERDHIGYDEGYIFVKESQQEAYLVATNLRQNPVYVAPDEMEKIA